LQELQVAADGHVRNPERVHEIGDANHALLTHAFEDQGLTLPGQGGPFGARIQTRGFLRHSVTGPSPAIASTSTPKDAAASALPRLWGSGHQKRP
jgi:hypothetical protein